MKDLVHVVLVSEATAAFVNQTLLCVHSFRRKAGNLADAPITVVFNDRGPDETSQRVLDRLRVTVEVKPRVASSVPHVTKFNGLYAKGLASAGWMLFLDCDTIINAPLDALSEHLSKTSAGFIGTSEHRRQAWKYENLWAKEIGGQPSDFDHLRHEHYRSAGLGRKGLPLFNIGVFALRSELCSKVADGFIPMCLRLYQEQTTSKWSRPLHYLKYKWNRRLWKKQSSDRWIIGEHYPRIHGAQVGLPIFLHKQGIKMDLFPHAWNYHYSGAGLGEDNPIRILHYLKSMYPFDRATMLPPAGTKLSSPLPWLLKAENDLRAGLFEPKYIPGWQALIAAAKAYLEDQH